MSLQLTVIAMMPWGERHEFKARRIVTRAMDDKIAVVACPNGKVVSILRPDIDDGSTMRDGILYQLGPDWRRELGVENG